MTQQDNDNVLQAAVELLNQNGFEAYGRVLQILLDQAMKIERTEALGAEPYERSKRRRATPTDISPRLWIPGWAESPSMCPRCEGI